VRGQGTTRSAALRAFAVLAVGLAVVASLSGAGSAPAQQAYPVGSPVPSPGRGGLAVYIPVAPRDARPAYPGPAPTTVAATATSTSPPAGSATPTARPSATAALDTTTATATRTPTRVTTATRTPTPTVSTPTRTPTGTPTPRVAPINTACAAAASAALTVTSCSARPSSSSQYAYAAFRNDGAATVFDPRATVLYYDASGRLLRTETMLLAFAMVRPGEISTGWTVGDTPAGWARFEVAVTAGSSSTLTYVHDGLDVSGLVAAPTSGGISISGSIRNNTDLTLSYPKLDIGVYARDGTIVDADTHYPFQDSYVPPGAATTFTATVFDFDGHIPSDYTYGVRAEGWASSFTNPTLATPTATSPGGASGATATPTATPVSRGGPTALCRDGTLSYSQHRSGTCSSHGGVSIWF
jgi:hypothetical protein